MRDEIATTMRLLGVTRLDQLGPHLVSTSSLTFISSLHIHCFFLLSLVFALRRERESSGKEQV
jgi:hypothetical protein